MLSQKELQSIHFSNIQKLAPNGLYTNDEKKFMRRIRTLENRFSRYSVAFCNGNIEQEEFDAIYDRITEQVERAFNGTLPDGFFINTDPRGFALKLRDTTARQLRQNGINIYTDFGGYGILSPEKF